MLWRGIPGPCALVGSLLSSTDRIAVLVVLWSMDTPNTSVGRESPQHNPKTKGKKDTFVLKGAHGAEQPVWTL